MVCTCIFPQTLSHITARFTEWPEESKQKWFHIIQHEKRGQNPEQFKESCSFQTHRVLHYSFWIRLNKMRVLSRCAHLLSNREKHWRYRNWEKQGQWTISGSLGFLLVHFVQRAKIALQNFEIHTWRSSGEEIICCIPECSKESSSSSACRFALPKEVTSIWKTPLGQK